MHEVKGLEKCPLRKISIDFCPIASLDDFGVFPSARIVELYRTGIRSADRDAVLRHFPHIWSLQYGDLAEGFWKSDMRNEVVCFGPTNIVFEAGGDKTKDLSFMGFDMDRPIAYDDEACALFEVGGMSDCVLVTRYESVVGLGRPFHGFTTVKLIGHSVEVERISDGMCDGPVANLEFEQVEEVAAFDFESEKKWAKELAAEMESVYGAKFSWTEDDENKTYLTAKGKNDVFDFVISSCAGAHSCDDGTEKKYVSRLFYVLR